MAIIELSTKKIVNLPSDPASGTAGEIYFNTVSNSFKYHNGTTWVAFSTGSNGLPAGGAAGDILAKIDGTDYNTEWIPNYTSQVQHTVKAAESILKGQAVYVTSATGTNMLVSKASNNSEATSSKTFGILAQNLATNDQGFVITEGLLSGVNTASASAGDPIWLGTGGNLIFGLANKPKAPNHLVYLGIVTRVHAVNGEIFVKVQNGYELEELHNVSISSLQDKDYLIYNSASNQWVNDRTYLLNSSSASQTKSGNLTISGTATTEVLDLNEAQITAKLNTIAVTTPVQIDSFNASGYRGAEYVLQLSQNSVNFIIVKIMLIHNGTDIAITEYGNVSIGANIPYEINGSFSLGNLEITITCSTANINPVDIKFARTLFDN